MAESSRLKELTDAAIRRIALPPPDHVVALSGGADSATLAFLAKEYGSLVSCIHVHHGLAASDRLAAAARDIADKLSVSLEIVTVVVAEGTSPENQARSARYEALEKSVSTDVRLLLGHTRNDQAETLLMNLVRGAGKRGLAGIPAYRLPNIYRPMLDVTRSETREIASLAGLAFVDDPLNDDVGMRRNFVRNDLIPRLEELNPQVVAALARTAALMAEDEAFLDDLASGVSISLSPEGATAAASPVTLLPRPVQFRFLHRMVSLLRQPFGVTTAEFARVIAVFEGSSSAAEIEAGIRFTRDGAVVRADVTSADGPE